MPRHLRSRKLGRRPFQALTVALLLAALVAGWRLHRNTFAMTGSFWLGSFVIYQVTIKYYTGHWALKPSKEYPSFWWGNLVILPLFVSAPLAVLANHLPTHTQLYWFEERWWALAAATLALAVAAGFRLTQRQVFCKEALAAPWKTIHDWFEFTFLSFILILNAPALWYSSWGFRSFHATSVLALVPLIGLGIWLYVARVRDRKRDRDLPPDKEGVTIEGWDWERSAVIPCKYLGHKDGKTFEWVPDLPEAA